MGVIINPRGTAGAGKTELVRRVLAQYGWRRGARPEGSRRAVALEHDMAAEACGRLGQHASVEVLGFDLALARVQDLLWLRQPGKLARPASSRD